MSAEPLKRCLEPGCRVRSTRSRCPAHDRTEDARRGSARARGYTSQWDTYSRRYLARNPLCGDRDGFPSTGHSVCAADRMVPNPAELTDHVQPHGGVYALMWDPANHQALCRPCHARKTATIDTARVAKADR